MKPGKETISDGMFAFLVFVVLCILLVWGGMAVSSNEKTKLARAQTNTLEVARKSHIDYIEQLEKTTDKIHALARSFPIKGEYRLIYQDGAIGHGSSIYTGTTNNNTTITLCWKDQNGVIRQNSFPSHVIDFICRENKAPSARFYLDKTMYPLSEKELNQKVYEVKDDTQRNQLLEELDYARSEWNRAQNTPAAFIGDNVSFVRVYASSKDLNRYFRIKLP